MLVRSQVAEMLRELNELTALLRRMKREGEGPAALALLRAKVSALFGAKAELAARLDAKSAAHVIGDAHAVAIYAELLALEVELHPDEGLARRALALFDVAARGGSSELAARAEAARGRFAALGLGGGAGG